MPILLDNLDKIREIQARMKDDYQRFKAMHREGCEGFELCEKISRSREAMLIDLAKPTWDTLFDIELDAPDSPVALVALGGSGRGDVSPFSDVDLMLLYRHSRDKDEQVHLLAKQYFRDVYDTGMQLGHSVRTPDHACSLAREDTQILTSLVDARLIGGNRKLFETFTRKFDRLFRGSASRWISDIEKERNSEKVRYGETIFLLEPNIKRTRGGLRDLQLLRWVAKARYGTTDLDQLISIGALTQEDRLALDEAKGYLLTLRNELHFAADRGNDILDMAMQQKISEQRGYQAATGMLPVESFMRDHFRLVGRASYIVDRFINNARPINRLTEKLTNLFGHRTSDGFRIGPTNIVAMSPALKRMQSDWTAVLQLVDLANLYDVPIHPETWEQVFRVYGTVAEQTGTFPVREDTTLDEKTIAHFLSFLSHSGRLGVLLRELHHCGLLERIIPEYRHARGLLQFNQYHKYTVDEHCIRAVDMATDLLHNETVLGRVYNHITQKHLLHLALLIHDLGKGHPDDHRERGERIAADTARRLQLGQDEAETLQFLVRHHELMNRIAFRRDTSDEALVVQFAVDVKSPERLRMLYVLTACDLAAVGPGVMDNWKAEVLTDLYRRTMRHLAGGSDIAEMQSSQRDEIKQILQASPDTAELVEHVDSLPLSLLIGVTPKAVAEQMRMLANLKEDGVRVRVDYRDETNTLQITVVTHDGFTVGIFHKLTGALAQKGLRILSAEISTLDPDLVLDRFVVFDPDFRDEPTAERLGEIEQALRMALIGDRKNSVVMPRKTWKSAQDQKNDHVQVAKTWVQADNHTSEMFTILDIFANDQPGLLHLIAQTLFDMGLSVHRAKVGTFIDQVVDVFYVVDRDGKKIESEVRIQQIRLQLLQKILTRD